MLSWRSARSRDFMFVVREVAKEQTGSSRAPLHEMRRFQARDEPASGSMGKEFSARQQLEARQQASPGTKPQGLKRQPAKILPGHAEKHPHYGQVDADNNKALEEESP